MKNWKNKTVTIMASGPSLCADDVCYAYLNSHKVIAINETWRLCPGADVLYGSDRDWWKLRAPSSFLFTGERWS